VLATVGQIPIEAFEGVLVVGELSLDGSVRHVRGVLPMTALARAEGYRTVFVPEVDSAEAALIPDVTVIPVANLAQLVNHLSEAEPIAPLPHRPTERQQRRCLGIHGFP